MSKRFMLIWVPIFMALAFVMGALGALAMLAGTPGDEPMAISRFSRVWIDSNADKVACEVEAWTTQTVNILEVQQSDDDVVFSVDNDGNTLISGTLTTSGTQSFLGDLDMGNNEILNIGASGTDFQDDGGLTTASTITVTAGGLVVQAGTASLNAGIAVDSPAFSVANTTGNTVISGTLVVSNTADFNAALDMSNYAITNIGAAGTDFGSNGSLTTAQTITVTAGGLVVSAGGANVTGGLIGDYITATNSISTAAIYVGATQWNSGTSIDGTKVADADLGDIGVSSGVWSVEDDSHNHVIGNIDTFSSAALYGQISDETGSASGSPLAVFNVNPTLTGATLAGILTDDDDMVFECDANNDGSNKFSFTDGASAEVASISEAGLLSVLVGIDAIGAVDMDYGSADITDHTFVTDGTGDGEIVLPDDSIGPSEMASGAYDLGTSLEADTLTEGGNAIYNSTETPGGELGGTWASPTIDDLFLKLGGDTTTGNYDFTAGNLTTTGIITGINVTSGADPGHTHTGASLSSIDISADTNLTAGDGLTLTDDDLDFDGGATPAGDLGGTWADPSVDDDSHAHTTTSISGLDISSDTNLTAGDHISLTDDDLDVDDDFVLNAGDTVAGNLDVTGYVSATSNITSVATIYGVGIDAGDGNGTNFGNVALDSLSSDAGTSINVDLGGDAGDDFTVDTDKLVVEGDMGNVGIGSTATITNGGKVLFFGNNAANPTGDPGVAGIYNNAGRLYGFDDNGTGVLLTPHDERALAPADVSPFPWGYSARNVYLGKETVADITSALVDLSKITGKQYIKYNDLPEAEVLSWQEQQEAYAERENARRLAEAAAVLVEVPQAEAVESYMRIETRPVSPMQYITTTSVVYEFDSATGLSVAKTVTVTTAITETVDVGLAWRLKAGCSLESTMGKFFCPVSEENATYEPYQIQEMPDWMQDRTIALFLAPQDVSGLEKPAGDWKKLANVGNYAIWAGIGVETEQGIELHETLWAMSPTQTLGALAVVKTRGESLYDYRVRTATGMTTSQALSRRNRIANYLDSLGKNTVQLRQATTEHTITVAIVECLGYNMSQFWAALD